MDLITLKSKLYESNAPHRWYSLNEGLKPNAFIIYQNYLSWECFYLDERGDRNDVAVFLSAEEAYEWLWKKIQEQLRIFKTQPRQDH